VQLLRPDGAAWRGIAGNSALSGGVDDAPYGTRLRQSLRARSAGAIRGMSDRQDIGALERCLEANEVAAWRDVPIARPSSRGAVRARLHRAGRRAADLEPRRANALFNRILALGAFEPADDALIDALLARAQAEHSRCMIQLGPSAQPAGLAERLQVRGMKAEPGWLMHVRAG